MRDPAVGRFYSTMQIAAKLHARWSAEDVVVERAPATWENCKSHGQACCSHTLLLAFDMVKRRRAILAPRTEEAACIAKHKPKSRVRPGDLQFS